jgi:hypothetical protein
MGPSGARRLGARLCWSAAPSLLLKDPLAQSVGADSIA